MVRNLGYQTPSYFSFCLSLPLLFVFRNWDKAAILNFCLCSLFFASGGGNGRLEYRVVMGVGMVELV